MSQTKKEMVPPHDSRVDGDLKELPTLIDILRARAKSQPAKKLYTFLHDGDIEQASHLTYAETEVRARAIAAKLQAMGARGERALLIFAPGLDYISAFLGCLFAGVIAVPTYPPLRKDALQRVKNIVQDSQAKYALTTSDIHAKVRVASLVDRDIRKLQWLSVDKISDAIADDWTSAAATRDDLAFLQYTSGSTASPKGVMVSHGNLMANERMIMLSMGHDENLTVVSWLPPYHDMGLIGNLLQPLYVGGHSIFMSPVAFLKRPFVWLQAITHYKATTCGGPNFAFDLCTRKIQDEQHATLDLSSLKVVYNGSEPIRYQTLKRFAAKFEACGFSEQAFFPCYGMAEATLIITGCELATAPVTLEVQPRALEENKVVPCENGTTRQMLVSSGKAVPGEEVCIVDPEKLLPCTDGEIGEIWVRGQNVAQGYWRREQETEENFGGRLKDGDGPYLRTGDLGFLNNGELFVTGRIKGLIIITGRNLYPHDIELTVAESHAAMRPGCTAAFSIDSDAGEELVVVQEIRRQHYRKLNADEVLGAARQAVSATFEVRVSDVVLVKPGRIPKTSSGKVKRYLCKSRYLQKELEIIANG